ncbi:MAG: hypothetical protein WD048_14225 [Chitinophagales bacterium]
MKHTLFYLCILLLAFIFTLPWHQGLPLGDDYIGAAYQFLKGNWDIYNNYYANRIGSFLPYAIGISLLGISEWLNYITTGIYIGLLVMVYLVLKKTDKKVALVATTLLSVSTVMHQNAVVVSSDMTTALTTNALVLIYYYFRFHAKLSKEKETQWGIITAVTFFTALLVKTSVVFYLPVLAWFFFKDYQSGLRNYYWEIFAMGSVFLGLILLVAYWIKTGDAFFRVSQTKLLLSANEYNYASSDWKTIINRLTWQPFRFLLENYSFGTLLLLSSLQIFSISKSSSDEQKFFKVLQIGTLGMWWFGSQGLTNYNPVALTHRLWLPLLVPMAINSAFFICRVIKGVFSQKTFKYIFFISVSFTALSAISLYSTYQSFSQIGIPHPRVLIIFVWYILYASITILSLYANQFFLKKPFHYLQNIQKIFFLLIIIPFLFANTYYLIQMGKNKFNGVKNNFESEKEIFLYTLNLRPDRIITDYNLYCFYYVYTLDLNNKLPVVDYNNVNPDSLLIGDYMLLSKIRQYVFEKNLTQPLTYTKGNFTIPTFVRQPQDYCFELIKENKSNKLYRFNGGEKCYEP